MNYLKQRAKETTSIAGYVLALVAAVLQVLVAFGVSINPEQQTAIIALATVAVGLIFYPEKVKK